MPPSKYTSKLPVYECQQYTGDNLEDIATWAPVAEHDGKVVLMTILGDVPIFVGDWVMQDNSGLFSLMADQYFQKGFKPGGGLAE